MTQSIVCGIDGSRVSCWAARVAAALAHEFDDRLLLVHVANAHMAPRRASRLRGLQHRRVSRDASALLERVAAMLPGIVPELKVLFGDPVEALTAACRDEQAEFLVVGSGGRSPVAAAVLGSVSRRLSSTSECPILVVPAPEAADSFLARTWGSHLVCGVDDSIGSDRAVRLAAGLAERMELKLLPVHIDADRTGNATSPGTSRPGLMVYRGKPVEGLRERALDVDASMIVVGSRGRGPWRAAALGSVSSALTATATVPVLVVPPSARLPLLAEDAAQATVGNILRDARQWTANRTQNTVVTDHTRPRMDAAHGAVGRFSEGLEQLPAAPGKLRQGRFSDGIADLPESVDELHHGRFSEGIEQPLVTAASRRRGSFADGHAEIPVRSGAALAQDRVRSAAAR
jgi:nucleotide-binding universal stress UspA family protein